MAKLIYSSAEWASASNATDGALRNYADSGDMFYKTLIFTKDGFLVTHGKVFRMVDTESLTSSVTIDISSATGKVTLTDGFKNLDALVKGKVRKEVRKNIRELEHTLKNTNIPKGNPTYISNVDDDESYAGKGWNIDI